MVVVEVVVVVAEEVEEELLVAVAEEPRPLSVVVFPPELHQEEPRSELEEVCGSVFLVDEVERLRHFLVLFVQTLQLTLH